MKYLVAVNFSNKSRAYLFSFDSKEERQSFVNVIKKDPTLKYALSRVKERSQLERNGS